MSNLKYIGPQEAAKLAGVTPATVINWIDAGEVPANAVKIRKKLRRREILIEKGQFLDWLKTFQD